MMKISKLLMLSLLSASLFVACSTSTTSTEESSGEETVKEACVYSYIADSTSLKWTAYKFAKKVGVSGTFNQITLNNAKGAETPMEVLIGADFSIETTSVNSGNLERDPKLVAHFFNKLVSTETITGKINSVNEDEAVVSITMNENTVDVVGKVTLEGEKISLEVSIDMSDFDGLDAIVSLNEVCSAKHTDEDGESKLWPEVSIVVSTVLKKECK